MYVVIFIIVLAYIMDLIVGDPYWFYHPVIIIGRLISYLEKKIRRIIDSKFGGFCIVITTMSIVGTTMILLSYLFFQNKVIGIAFSIISICTCFSTKSLAKESLKVKRPLENKDIKGARKFLSYIVGRDTTYLDENEIIRATVETIAENTVDGTISPLFYAFLGGLIGIFVSNKASSMEGGLTYAVVFSMLYKAVNTMDSMIGYKNKKYINIGMFAARLDDVANFIPARLSMPFFTIASFLLGFDYKSCFKISIRDRKNHKSPNCAYPEGAVAGALGIRLGGDNVYFGELVKKPTIGDFKKELEIKDIDDTIKLLYLSTLIGVVLFTFISLLLIYKFK